MTIFNHGDICRYICRYLSIESICMFRRCNRQLGMFLSGSFLYDRKTTYLKDSFFKPSEIMIFTMDIGYRRYLKKRGWRAIAPLHCLQWITTRDMKLFRYIIKAKPQVLRQHCSLDLVRTKDRELIDLYRRMCHSEELAFLFRQILDKGKSDDELIEWFAQRHITLDFWTQVRKCDNYSTFESKLEEWMWNNYGPKFFSPVENLRTNKLQVGDVLFALDKGILSRRVYRHDLHDPSYYVHHFVRHGYVERGNYFIKYD